MADRAATRIKVGATEYAVRDAQSAKDISRLQDAATYRGIYALHIYHNYDDLPFVQTKGNQLRVGSTAYVLYDGSDGDETTPLHKFYRVKSMFDTTLEWEEFDPGISTSGGTEYEAGAGITIDDAVISADTNIFYGELDEFNALDAEEKAKYSHISTPESEDALVPSAKVTQLSDGARIDITDQNGTTTATVKNVAGELIPSVSKYQSGTVQVNTLDGSTGWYYGNVTFATPMPDTDYVINLEISPPAWTNATVGDNHTPVCISNKTVNGFKLGMWQWASGIASLPVKWQAFKLMTDAALLADEAQIAQNAGDIAELKTSVATNTSDISVLKTRTQAVCTDVKIKAGGLTARKSGKVVTVNGATQFSADLTRNSWVEIATLPSGYRPSNYEYGTAVVDSGEGSVTCPIDVDASGSMRVFIYEKSIPTTLSLNDHYLFISLCFTQN